MHPSLLSTSADAKTLGASYSTSVTRGVGRLSRAMALAGVVFLLFFRLVARVRLPRAVARPGAVLATSFAISRAILLGAGDEPFIPRQDTEVVARLRPAGTSAAERGLHTRRELLDHHET